MKDIYIYQSVIDQYEHITDDWDNKTRIIVEKGVWYRIPLFVAYYWECIMHGFSGELEPFYPCEQCETYDCVHFDTEDYEGPYWDIFEIEEDEKQLFPELEKYKQVRVCKDEQGFIVWGAK